MGILVCALFRVMQDLYHQPYPYIVPSPGPLQQTLTGAVNVHR